MLASTTLIITISAVIIIMALISFMVMNVAYRLGVRDGYQNTFLRHVQEQVREEKLMQGREVER